MKITSKLGASVVALGLAAGAAQANLLTNGGFDVAGDGTLFDGWLNFDNVFAEPLGFDDSDAAKMFGNFNFPFNFSNVQQVVPVDAGTLYTASVFSLHLTDDAITGTQNQAIMKVEWLDAADDVIGFDERIVLDGSSPTDIYFLESFNAEAPAGAVNARFVLGFLQPDFEGGSAYFENASFVVFPAPGAVGLLATAGLVAARRRR